MRAFLFQKKKAQDKKAVLYTCRNATKISTSTEIQCSHIEEIQKKVLAKGLTKHQLGLFSPAP